MDLLHQVTANFGGKLVPEMIQSYWKVFLMMIFGLVVHWLPTSVKDWYREWFIQTPVWLKIIICVAVVFIIYQVVSAGIQPFIYFQF
jgi:alginate O-acetyltransferase complex protein AlgI